MIEQLRLQNARVFSDTDWIFDFRPLTVVCGTNSAGKSTLLKSLLLLQANFSGRREQFMGPQPIAFNGPDLDLGNFATFISHEDATRTLTLGFTISTNQRMLRSLAQHVVSGSPTVRVEGSLRVGFDDAESTPSPSLIPTGLGEEGAAILKRESMRLVFGDGSSIDWDIEWSRRRKTDPTKAYVLRASAKDSAIFEPSFQFRTPTKPKPRRRSIVTQVLINRCLPEYVMDRTIEPSGAVREAFYPPNLFLNDINRTVDTAFSRTNLIYIGPLRAPARRYYVLTTDESTSLDASGDFLPYVLKRMHDLRAYDLDANGDSSETGLALPLSRWLYFLRTGERKSRGAGDELRTRITKDVLLEAMLMGATGNEHHALADSGFGYSQVLPIVVRTLMARPGSAVLIEQPEVHLNPALQVRLADFFVAMTRVGKQLIIETHSEHIVNSLRVIAAEDSNGDVARMLQLFYIGAGEEAPIVHDMNVSSDGSLSEWPQEFFGEALTLTQRLLRAQANRRAAVSQK